MTSDEELYARARRLVTTGRAELDESLDRVLGAADRELGERLEEAVRLGELCLIAHVDPWWTGSPRPNLRRAIAGLDDRLHDPLALGLAVRLALGYARLGRVDDDAHRLASLARRLVDAGLSHPLDGYAREAGKHLERALFSLSAERAYALVKDLTPDEARALAASHLARGNPTLCAQLCELRLVRALDDWYVGPALGNVESALATYRVERAQPDGGGGLRRRGSERSERAAEAQVDVLHELALLLGRAYVRGAFVDLRAKEHVAALIEGPEAKLLGPEEAIGFREFVDRDCFDYPYAHLYALVKRSDPEALRARVRKHIAGGGLEAARRLCEMALVRRYADWFFGEPTANVRGAISRYLDAMGGDQDAEWFARTLAGLYLATLEGAAHARRLVRSVVRTAPDAPELKEAVAAAGIGADVPLSELASLYARSVELEARVEAFRAEAAAAGQLSAYEERALGDVLEFLEEAEPTLLDDVTRTLGDLVEVVTPEVLVRSVTAIVEDALRLATTGAAATLGRDRILAALARRDPRLRSIDALREAGLEAMDEVAWSITRENRVAAALEGLGCGLGGPTLVLVDLPMLVLVNLNALAAIAAVYGFDPSLPAERDVIVGLLAGGRAGLRRVVGAERHAAGDDDHAASPSNARAAMTLHVAAGELASRLARQKLLQVVPVLGGAVGAGLNFQFTAQTTRTAVMAYRYRWLLRRFRVVS